MMSKVGKEGSGHEKGTGIFLHQNIRPSGEEKQ